MSTTTLNAGTRTTLTGASTALASLTNTSYVVAGTIDVSAVDPVELVVEAEVTAVGAANNFVTVFAKASFDNTNFGTGPESGTTTTDEPDLHVIGYIPTNNTGSTQHRKAFSVMQALGFIPPYLKIIVKNSAGATLSAGNVFYTTYTAVTV